MKLILGVDLETEPSVAECSVRPTGLNTCVKSPHFIICSFFFCGKFCSFTGAKYCNILYFYIDYRLMLYSIIMLAVSKALSASFCLDHCSLLM